MKTHVIDAGQMICTDGSQLSAKYAAQSEIPLANPLLLIEHPKGLVLWDTGLPDALAAEKDGIQNWIFHLRHQQTVQSQLKNLGYTPDDIDYLVFSHMHVDHTGNANLFSSATLVLQEAEYQAAFLSNERPMNYEDYRALADSEVIRVEGDHDLFGDGRLMLISTPGHTPGHQSLLLDTGKQKLLLSGDISYTMDHFEHEGIPTFNYNADQSLQSIHKIKMMMEVHRPELWIQHDPQHFEHFKSIL